MASGEEIEQSSNSIIYITEEHRVEWAHDATKEVLKLYDEKCDLLETGIINTQKKLWELVAKDMCKRGYYYSGAQCENKWKALKRSYRTKVEKLEKYGHCKRPCPFEDEITEILSKRPQETYTRSFYTAKIKQLKKDPFDVNLNDPPGFTKEENDGEDLKNLNIIHNEESADEELLQNNAEYMVQDLSQPDQGQLIEELSELRKVISKHNRLNTQILKQSCDIHGKMSQYFDGATQRQCQTLELEETRMEQQNEVIKQMKIQNSLLQKLLEKLT